MQFINLKKQYKRLESDIDKRIKAVLEHGQFIMGPEIDELEKRLSKFSDSLSAIDFASPTPLKTWLPYFTHMDSPVRNNGNKNIIIVNFLFNIFFNVVDKF